MNRSIDSSTLKQSSVKRCLRADLLPSEPIFHIQLLQLFTQHPNFSVLKQAHADLGVNKLGKVLSANEKRPASLTGYRQPAWMMMRIRLASSDGLTYMVCTSSGL